MHFPVLGFMAIAVEHWMEFIGQNYSYLVNELQRLWKHIQEDCPPSREREKPW